MTDSLDQLQQEIKALAALINVPLDSYAFPSFGYTRDFGCPHIEVDSNNYHYVSVERGKETERFTTSSKEDLLYRVFREITFSMASAYEAMHRIPNQDFRRVLFSHQLQLLNILSPKWATRCELEINTSLQNYPYRDG